MSELRIVAVVGNPNPGGRTTRMAEAVARQVAHLAPWSAVEIVELSAIADQMFDPDAQAISDVCARVASADVAVFASPTYKAGIAGLLKAFFDRFETDGLAGVIAIPVMVGGIAEHALAVEMHLRPVLVELAATVPTKGLFVLDRDIEGLGDRIETWWEHARSPIRKLLGV